ncbi:MAG: response regulator [Oscillospiraceae bacterium]|nr:response regulator [Oscillospiraceae bacterium]
MEIGWLGAAESALSAADRRKDWCGAMEKNGRHSILVVDDSVLNTEMLESILAGEYTVYKVNNGADAVAAANRYLPDVVLLDIVMSGMDGYAVITALKSSERTRDIPVIFLTALANVGDEDRGLSLGGADYITKPFSTEIVKLRIKNQLMLRDRLLSAEYDIMNFKLASSAMKIALWGVDVVIEDPTSPENRVMWSQELRQMLGFSDENDFPNTIEAFASRFHPEDSERSFAAFAAHFNDRTGKTPYDIEYRLKHKNGEYRYFDGFGTTLRDENGVPLRVSGTVRDITEKKLTELALEKNEKLLRAVNRAASVLLTAGDGETFKDSLLEGMRIVGLGVDADCVEIWQNETRDGGLHAVLKYYWFSETGRKIKTDSPVSSFPYSASPRWESRLSRGDYIKGAVSGLSREDQEFLSAFRIKTVLAIPIFMQNMFWGFCCIDDCRNSIDFAEGEVSILRSVCYMLASALNRNISAAALRRAEIAEESSKAKSRFLATMSHEIRTPMNGIMGFAELALDTPGGAAPQVRDYLDKIRDSTKWLLNIINDILDISKIESGKMELENVTFSLRDIVNRCKSVIMPGVKEKGLDFIVYANPPLSEPLNGKKLLGDPVRLYQALMNLLSNAVKFTNSGGVRLMTVIKSTDGGVTVYFEVKDTGIGMSAEQVEKIFDPFIQADSSTTREYGGTGLGLAITKNIVGLMGGTLKVDSSPGAGSVFSFEIVFDTADSAGGTQESAKLDMLEKPNFSGLVLVCDDNAMNQQVICEHLTHVGLKTTVAENGQIGVELVRERMLRGENPYDLILMDMYMPVMGGIEAAAEITALNTGTPIVAMTANIMASDLENYRKHGMPDYVGKPFTSQELWRVLLKYLPSSDAPAPPAENKPREKELLKKLQLNFVKSNQTKFAEITAAIYAGEAEHAHRLAHSLKGNAGFIGKAGLQKAAAEVEALLKNGAAPIPDKIMERLNTELAAVLEELKPLLDGPGEEIRSLSDGQALALFDKLEPMLDKLNPECVEFLDEIRAVSGTEELARLIENYDFEAAAGALAGIKMNWRGRHVRVQEEQRPYS